MRRKLLGEVEHLMLLAVLRWKGGAFALDVLRGIRVSLGGTKATRRTRDFRVLYFLPQFQFRPAPWPADAEIRFAVREAS